MTAKNDKTDDRGKKEGWVGGVMEGGKERGRKLGGMETKEGKNGDAAEVRNRERKKERILTEGRDVNDGGKGKGKRRKK